jgi:hypothetical protein
MAQKKQKQKRLRAKTPQKYAKYASTKSKFEAVKVPKLSKEALAELKKFYGDIDRTKLAKKSVAKKGIGRAIARKIPGVGAAIVAHDVMRAGAKKGCIKRGGKWVGKGIKARCQTAKK